VRFRNEVLYLIDYQQTNQTITSQFNTLVSQLDTYIASSIQSVAVNSVVVSNANVTLTFMISYFIFRTNPTQVTMTLN
jgi:hypothetical protein